MSEGEPSPQTDQRSAAEEPGVQEPVTGSGGSAPPPPRRQRWQPPPPPKRPAFPLSGTAVWGFVTGLLGFVVTIAYHEANLVDGELVRESYIDFGPFLMGVIVGLIGIRVLLQVSRGELLPGKPAGLHKVLGVVFIGLGALHVLRGVMEIRWTG